MNASKTTTKTVEFLIKATRAREKKAKTTTKSTRSRCEKMTMSEMETS